MTTLRECVLTTQCAGATADCCSAICSPSVLRISRFYIMSQTPSVQITTSGYANFSQKLKSLSVLGAQLEVIATATRKFSVSSNLRTASSSLKAVILGILFIRAQLFNRCRTADNVLFSHHTDTASSFDLIRLLNDSFPKSSTAATGRIQTVDKEPMVHVPDRSKWRSISPYPPTALAPLAGKSTQHLRRACEALDL